MTKPLDSDDVHERILEAARATCVRWGIERTRMEDIAKAAGVSRPNLYNYFRNKEELMLALVSQTAQRINDHFEQTLPIQGPSSRLFLSRLVGGVEIGLRDELTRGMHATHNNPLTWEPMRAWWLEAFTHARRRSEFRPRLDNDDALRWIRFAQTAVLEHPERFDGLDDIRTFFKLFVVPPLLNPAVA